jgi:uncharacterized protein
MSHPRPADLPTLSLNINVDDPAASQAFFTSLGFGLLTEYTDEQTKSLWLPAPNNLVCLMLHGAKRFKSFMRPDTAIVDAHTSTEVLFSLPSPANTREDVDEFIAKVVAAGGKADPFKLENFGLDCGMYSRSFSDLDGHIWEMVAMFPPQANRSA